MPHPNFGKARDMSDSDYNKYSGGLEIDKDILTYSPQSWVSKQKRRNSRKTKYESNPDGVGTGETTSDDSADEPPPKIIPKKNKKSGKKEYTDEQKAALVARLKAGRAKAKAARAAKKATPPPPVVKEKTEKPAVIVNTPTPVKKVETPKPAAAVKPERNASDVIQGYFTAMERRFEERLNSQEARHKKEMETSRPTIVPKVKPTPPAAPIPIPKPAISLGRFKNAAW